jgi:hypothetical protein
VLGIANFGEVGWPGQEYLREYQLSFEIVGKNKASSDYLMGLDAISFVPLDPEIAGDENPMTILVKNEDQPQEGLEAEEIPIIILPILQPRQDVDDTSPIIVSLEWNPTAPLQDDNVTFTVHATDNVGIEKIEIYLIRHDSNARGPIATCNGVQTCEYVARGDLYPGMYSYYAIAYDKAGNKVSSFNQVIEVLPAIK